MNNIYLVGLPGSGKSTSGKRFAKKLGRGYIDLDKLIELRSKTKIATIFEKQGEDAFREMESSCLRETAQSTKLVVGCGGGTAAWGDNMSWMLDHGLVIWIDIPLEELTRRIKHSRNERPLFPSRKSDDIRLKLEELLARRITFYSRASYRVHSEAELLRLSVAM